MAQTGFTPISIYYSSTASAAPTAGNLVAGELAINTADGKLFYKDSAGAVQVIGTKGGVGSSTTTQVLFNSSGLVAGSANLTWNGTTLAVLSSGLAASFAGTSIQMFNVAATSQMTFTQGQNASIQNYFATGSSLAFTTNANGGGNTEAIRVDSTQFVGIGTSTPDTRLTVRKTDVDGDIITIQGANGVNGAIGVHAGGNGGVYLQAAATRDLRLRVGTTELFTVDKDKSAALQGASPQTGSGITFPATQSGSSNANTLDDYEEGTWTPADNSGAGLTFTSVGAAYTKIGRLVTCQFNVNYPVTASTAQASINGLPYASGAVSNLDNPIGGFITYTSANITFTVPGGSSATSINFWNLAGGQITNAQLSGANIRMTVVYISP